MCLPLWLPFTWSKICHLTWSKTQIYHLTNMIMGCFTWSTNYFWGVFHLINTFPRHITWSTPEFGIPFHLANKFGGPVSIDQQLDATISLDQRKWETASHDQQWFKTCFTWSTTINALWVAFYSKSCITRQKVFGIVLVSLLLMITGMEKLKSAGVV